DVTYGTNNEFGFDYLRDNMVTELDERVQRDRTFGIVDEVDNILIDEARTPLIISGQAEESADLYYQFARLMPRLRERPADWQEGDEDEGDYFIDLKDRAVSPTEAGIEKIEKLIGVENLYDADPRYARHFDQALKSHALYLRDRDYIVKDGEIIIVDEFTGRQMPGRRWSEGLHQAIEAKEGLRVQRETVTMATITFQNYFRLYDKLAGMTGTAMTEANEFHQIYKLGVVPIPTNRPMVRADEADLVYRTEDAKFNAVIDDLVERHEKGQPVLVGTTSVEKSELLSGQLRRRGVPHEVLNAKNHEREAQIVAQAGRKGAVTVATNMAGRGTDIMLGGNPEFMATAELAQRGLSTTEDPEAYEAAWPDALEKASKSVSAEHEEVVGVGGLYVLGTERHESRRIDNQLRGRSGRQGDPGETRFYLSLEDDLMRLFKGNVVDAFLTRFNIPDEVPIEAKMVTNAIKSAQGQVEAQNFETRKNVLKYDDVLNRQRQVIYAERRRVLEGEDVHDQIEHMLRDTVEGYVRGATSDGFPEEWDLEQLWTALKTLYPVGVTIDGLEEASGGDRSGLSADFLVAEILDDADAALARREQDLGHDAMRELERRVVLSVLDRKWREHLYEMDYLREGIGLRAMAQRDPLVEYQREGFDLFAAMMDGIKEESVGFVFNLEVEVEAPAAADAGVSPDDSMPFAVAPEIHAKGLDEEHIQAGLQYSAPTLDGGGDGGTATQVTATTATTATAKDGQYAGTPRNAPCPCGSGKKYKKCHGAPGRA
ncbi:MAG: preprotein translocase subunit SecA, partial [Actinomycetes bacterium]